MMLRRSFIICALALFLASASLTTMVRADAFLLKKGGKVEGELLNPQEVPRKSYRIEVEKGFEIELESKYVERSRKTERQALLEYESFAPFEENSIENHLRIALWCRENQLPELNRRHLNQVLELDPNHAEARKLLGHIKTSDGSWTTRREQLEKSGIIHHAGRLKTQQQIDVEKLLEKREQAKKAWEKEISSLRSLLPHNDKARNRILSIKDAAAGASLRRALDVERNEDTRILLIRALANIGTMATMYEIARWTLNPKEPVAEVRQTCFDELRKRSEALPAIIGFYTAHLDPTFDKFTINAAAYALGELNGTTAIPQLISVLTVPREQTRTVKADGPAFSNTGGTSLGWGESKKKDRWIDENPRVLDALIRLTGGTNASFQYNKNLWKAWLIESRRTPSFNARRG